MGVPLECCRTGLAYLLAQREFEAIGALEAGSGDWIDEGLSQGTVSVVIFHAFPKNLELVLLFCDVAVDPVLDIQVVLIFTLAYIHQPSRSLGFKRAGSACAVGRADLLYNPQIILLAKDGVIKTS